jgi:hypothetical protein
MKPNIPRCAAGLHRVAIDFPKPPLGSDLLLGLFQVLRVKKPTKRTLEAQYDTRCYNSQKIHHE